MSQFVYSFSIIVAGLLLGYGVRILVRRRRLELYISLADLRQILQKAALLIVNPVAILGAVWIVDLGSGSILNDDSATLFLADPGLSYDVCAVRVVVDLDGGFVSSVNNTDLGDTW